MSVAQVLEPLVERTLGDRPVVHVRCWDGSEFGPPDAPVQVHFARRTGLRRVLWRPDELGFARAYVAGDIEVEGDLAFYRLVLGPTMVYSCGYFEKPPSPSYGLDDAQRAKLDLVARKLGLREGMRVLDVGCGWGRS